MNRELRQFVEIMQQLWAEIRGTKPLGLEQLNPTFKETFLDPLSKMAGQEISVHDVAICYRWKYDYLTLKLNEEYLEVRYVEQEDGTIKFAPRKTWTVLDLD